MTKEKAVKLKAISLGEYAWDYHKKNDVPMGIASLMLKEADNIPGRKTRVKKNRSTPLLTYPEWDVIWVKHYPDE